MNATYEWAKKREEGRGGSKITSVFSHKICLNTYSLEVTASVTLKSTLSEKNDQVGAIAAFNVRQKSAVSCNPFPSGESAKRFTNALPTITPSAPHSIT